MRLLPSEKWRPTWTLPSRSPLARLPPCKRLPAPGGVKVVSNSSNSHHAALPIPPIQFTYAESSRVTDGARTRDLRSHNPMLCLLSYGHHAHGDSTSEKARGKAWSVSPAEELGLLV